jgi:hypothetical protein
MERAAEELIGRGATSMKEGRTPHDRKSFVIIFRPLLVATCRYFGAASFDLLA